jgi:hypothetical protein
MAALWRIDETTGGRDEAKDADVWFQQPARGALAEVITIAGEAGEPLPGEVLVSIISVVPALPAGVKLELTPPTKSKVVRLTLTTSDARILGGQNPRILELGVEVEPGGPVVDVREFGAITAEHQEVITYRPDPSHRPYYSITIEATDWAANGGVKRGTERRTYVFGLRKDYTPNRDALAAAVNLRRKS